MGAKQSSIAGINTNSQKQKKVPTRKSQNNIESERVQKNIVPLKKPQFSVQQCEKLFENYASSNDKITPDGTQQFFKDLDLSIEDAIIFAISWKMQAKSMGYISKQEWMSTMERIKADTIEKIKMNKKEFYQVFEDAEQFKEMYKYSFDYTKNKDQKSLEVETAIVVWTMLLGERFPVAHEFVEFLQEEKPVKVINRDQWNSFLEFASSDLSNYDESSAWPVLFDEFVDWRKKSK